MEIQTPVINVFTPNKASQFRDISGLLNFEKISQKVFGEMMTSDMKMNMDHSQY